jgi:hypothetical protein
MACRKQYEGGINRRRNLEQGMKPRRRRFARYCLSRAALTCLLSSSPFLSGGGMNLSTVHTFSARVYHLVLHQACLGRSAIPHAIWRVAATVVVLFSVCACTSWNLRGFATVPYSCLTSLTSLTYLLIFGPVGPPKDVCQAALCFS